MECDHRDYYIIVDKKDGKTVEYDLCVKCKTIISDLRPIKKWSRSPKAA